MSDEGKEEKNSRDTFWQSCILLFLVNNLLMKTQTSGGIDTLIS
jgi:hypothetical protein